MARSVCVGLRLCLFGILHVVSVLFREQAMKPIHESKQIEEIWRPITGFEEKYSVSNLGRIMSHARSGNWRCKSDRILKLTYPKNGYSRISLVIKDLRVSTYVHFLVSDAFLGPKPLGLTVNHKNGVKTDNVLGNLEYVTYSENVKHAYRLGLARAIRGEDSGRAKLTNQQVREIKKKLAAKNETQRAIAKKYGVSDGTIWMIAKNLNWKSVV